MSTSCIPCDGKGHQQTTIKYNYLNDERISWDQTNQSRRMTKNVLLAILIIAPVVVVVAVCSLCRLHTISCVDNLICWSGCNRSLLSWCCREAAASCTAKIIMQSATLGRPSQAQCVPQRLDCWFLPRISLKSTGLGWRCTLKHS